MTFLEQQNQVKESGAVGKRIIANRAFPRVNVQVGDSGLIVKDCGTGHYEIRFTCQDGSHAGLVLRKDLFDGSMSGV